MKATKRNYSRLYAIVGKLDKGGLTNDEFIAERIAIITNGKKAAKSDLTVLEHQMLVADVSAIQDHKKNPDYVKADKARKRVIAAIGQFLRTNKYEENMPLIKAIACRAAGTKDFNKIPLQKLNSLYNFFINDADIRKVAGEFATLLTPNPN